MERALSFVGLVALSSLLGCVDAQEAEHVHIPVVVDGRALRPCTTDLGYLVEVHEARLAIAHVEFTVAGEVHSLRWWQHFDPLFAATAHAHPGHSEGGGVAGELPGQFLVDWFANEGATLGEADLIVGKYTAANFGLARATRDNVGSPDDLLLGHTAILSGTATRGGTVVDFVVRIDSPVGRQLVGVPFDVEVSSATPEMIGLQFTTIDPFEQDTLFDAVDFHALADGASTLELMDPAGDNAIVDAYNTLRRTFQTHDHFRFVDRDEP